MTLDVYHGRKTTTQQQYYPSSITHIWKYSNLEMHVQDSYSASDTLDKMTVTCRLFTTSHHIHQTKNKIYIRSWFVYIFGSKGNHLPVIAVIGR